WPIAAVAQQPPKVARLAYLGPTSAAGSRTRVEALRSGLRNLGYIEGRNLEIAFRWADDKYESLLRLAAELVSLNPNVIVPHGAPEELEKAYTAMLAQRAEALVIIEDAMLNGNLRKIADLATKHRVPAIGLPEFAEAGALMAYGVDLVDMFYRSAYFVDK